MNKLFLSLSLLTIAFSAVAEEAQMGYIAKARAQAVVLGKAVANKASVLSNAVANKAVAGAQKAQIFGVKAKSNLWDKSLTIRGHEFKHGRKVATASTAVALTAASIYAYKKGYFGKLYNYALSTRLAGYVKKAGVKVADLGSQAMQYRVVSYPVAATFAIVKAPFKMAAYPFRKAAQFGTYAYSKLPSMPKFGKATAQPTSTSTENQTTPVTKSAPVETPVATPVAPTYAEQVQAANRADAEKHAANNNCHAGHKNCTNPKCKNK